MSVDVFGRQLIQSKEVIRGPPGIGFSLTKESNFDIQNKRLCNVNSAVDPTDAVSLEALQALELKIQKQLKELKDSIQQLQRKFWNAFEKDKLSEEELQRVTEEELKRILSNET